jgi:hypothetical protein
LADPRDQPIRTALPDLRRATAKLLLATAAGQRHQFTRQDVFDVLAILDHCLQRVREIRSAVVLSPRQRLRAPAVLAIIMDRDLADVQRALLACLVRTDWGEAGIEFILAPAGTGPAHCLSINLIHGPAG